MKKLNNIRNFSLILTVTLFSAIIIDSVKFKGKYSYTFLFLMIVSLLSTCILSIIIYDNKTNDLMETLKDGKSFELDVIKIDYDKYRAEAYAKYMRILNGID